MKLALGHMLGFGMMFAVCYVALAAIALFLPLIGAFISWDLAPLSFGWQATFLWMRLIAVFSAFMGVLFTFSKEGSGLARDFAENN